MKKIKNYKEAYDFALLISGTRVAAATIRLRKRQYSQGLTKVVVD